jgi:hypothetical protein
VKNIVLSVITFVAFVVRVPQSQDPSGTWQGTLPVNGREARIVVKISNETGGLKALLSNIDQGGNAIPSGTMTVQGSSVKISFPAIGGTYEGKLSADGNSLIGTWTRFEPVPLNLQRATAGTAWIIPEPPAPPKPMAADANPAFEVATIKLSPAGRSALADDPNTKPASIDVE